MKFKTAYRVFFIVVLFIACDTEKSEMVLFEEEADILAEPIVENIETPVISKTENIKNWMTHMQRPNGLLESVEDSDFVSLYDNALAVLYFTATNDFDKAEKTLDFFNAKMELELLNGTGGFYQFRNKEGENGNRTWLGDNAWLLIAINNYHHYAKNEKYKTMATNLNVWIRSLQDTDGGLWGGYNANGTRIHKISEGIITAFNAIEGYDDFHKNLLTYLKNERWEESENTLVAWPENPTYNYALDLHSLAFGVLENCNTSILDNTSRYLNTQIATVTTNEITGYCFDEDKDVVWLEGSAQMAVAYRSAENEIKAEALITEIEKSFINSSKHTNTIGVPYSTNYASSFGTDLLWDHADMTPAISSTVWYLFAKLKFNPFSIEKQKNIPMTERFWL